MDSGKGLHIHQKVRMDSPPIATSCVLLGGWMCECQEPFRPRTFPPSSPWTNSFLPLSFTSFFPTTLFFLPSPSDFLVRSNSTTPSSSSSPEPRKGKHASQAVRQAKNNRWYWERGYWEGGCITNRWRKRCFGGFWNQVSYLWLVPPLSGCSVYCSSGTSLRSSPP